MTFVQCASSQNGGGRWLHHMFANLICLANFAPARAFSKCQSLPYQSTRKNEMPFSTAHLICQSSASELSLEYQPSAGRRSGAKRQTLSQWCARDQSGK